MPLGKFQLQIISKLEEMERITSEQRDAISSVPDELTGEDAQRLAFARLLLHKPRWVCIDDALDSLDMADRKTILALFDGALKGSGVLSLGRGRLVELGRALMCDPRLVFLDEPSSGLDHRETDDMGTALLTVQRERNVALLLCEHDVPFVQRLASRTYVLDCGRLIASGATDDVLADPLVRTAYLGTSA